MTYEYWQHQKSGELYAVRLDEHRVNAAYGPIHHTDFTAQNLPHFDWDEEDGLFVTSLAEEFKMVSPRG